ncbi:uncharacterized protein LOC100926037 [Sarcophilus harrisii]|uniref:uncharacterized protein LOC100926037 n=1 Tax=Sarcophilus harrisii TaxID=9305 RepID=UPI000273AC87|nr:uncharacterized protein LOC100926037 [Sarcophilus harrisii]XP_031818509.1 uncharacterized protein LOC100926037 [Sarcophilus harrisii]XP_031818510.1 uncharacterized protein LOC100926037 [Sarcophilus harrisii]XP_031818511.1 uncharacterized protein LOC100926037 [Sarcophilus harrisii]XP_031818512.1 uncharacterized protein LOC100926037 [Sarcophilus harrisii]XP_031818513.1 uncharacterized protein LOC100926037 [Sarcophilus harrisii]XP_031818514.1 uncharacterized protein LOC100926037 [Sarcophilus 
MSGYSSNRSTNSLNIPYLGSSFYSSGSSRPGSPKKIQPKAMGCPGRPFCSVCPSRSEVCSSPNKGSRKVPLNPCCGPKADDPSSEDSDPSKKPACRGRPHCMLCMDRPRNTTFLDCLIEGIDYLDRSLNNEALSDKPGSSKTTSSKTPVKEVVKGETTSKANLATKKSVSKTSQTSPTSLQRFSGRSGGKNGPLSSKSGSTSLQDDPWMGASIKISHIPKIWESIQAGWAAKPDPKAALWW